MLLVGLLFFSCEEEQSIGNWDDNIKLSQKEVEFDKENNSIKITTQGNWWWIDNLNFNGQDVTFDRETSKLKDFVIEKNEFKIERKNSQEIFINVRENKTGKDRILIITLEAGDYFDRIRVIQKK